MIDGLNAADRSKLVYVTCADFNVGRSKRRSFLVFNVLKIRGEAESINLIGTVNGLFRVALKRKAETAVKGLAELKCGEVSR